MSAATGSRSEPGPTRSKPVSGVLLKAVGISKRYGPVEALKPTDFSVSAGTVHGVLGKNGAGKSTLMGIIAGSIPPTTGRVALDGTDVTSRPLAERRRLGIRLLSQHSEVVASLSVAENLVMPDYPTRTGLIDWSAVWDKARSTLEKYSLDLPLGTAAGLLSVPDQRKLNIVKTLVDDGKLAILDEPTTSLTRSERLSLFAWIRDLNTTGETFIYISHFNNEIRELCNEYTVVRDGSVVARGGSPGDMSPGDLSKMVTGADVHEFRREVTSHPDPLLELDEFQAQGAEPVSLSFASGEIVGFVGLPASGANEVARSLAGLRPVLGGEVRLRSRRVWLTGAKGAMASGIAYLTGDRIGEGLVPDLSVRESLALGRWPTGTLGLLDHREMQRVFGDLRERLSMQVSGPLQPVGQLSGGNQQKVLLGRLLAARPQVLILDEPTLGIDVGAKEEVHRIINELTAEGLAVIVLAYDTDELVRLVDRAVVFRDGAVVDELAGEQLTIEGILRALDPVPVPVPARTAGQGTR